jgi:hypothetical protein
VERENADTKRWLGVPLSIGKRLREKFNLTSFSLEGKHADLAVLFFCCSGLEVTVTIRSLRGLCNVSKKRWCR